MNRRLLPLIVGSILLPLGCGGTDDRTDPNAALILQASVPSGEPCSDRSDAAIATFEDANLAAAVRAALSVGAQDELTCGLVSALARLDAREAEIESLVGTGNLTGLRHLDLRDNSITDISPLSGLTGLNHLDLARNSITDLGALGGLTSLTELYLDANSISDISALSGLTSLTSLYFNNNSVSDISSLSGLTRLRDLNLTYNSISDISVLSEFTELAVLRLYNNPITDIIALRGLTSLTELHVHDLPDLSNIQPLLNNTGLGAGDRVILMRSDVSCADAAALKAKGVSVGSNCLHEALIEWWWAILAGAVAVVGAVVVAWRGLRGKR